MLYSKRAQLTAGHSSSYFLLCVYAEDLGGLKIEPEKGLGWRLDSMRFRLLRDEHCL